jgi:hypothetical protein
MGLGPPQESGLPHDIKLGVMLPGPGVLVHTFDPLVEFLVFQTACPQLGHRTEKEHFFVVRRGQDPSAKVGQGNSVYEVLP